MELGPTVLVVDDDAFMRSLLQRIFSDAGIQVRTFESARRLLDEADLQSPCVLVLDVVMPGMSGPQLHSLLRERGFTAPIIFLTAKADLETAVTEMRNGAADFLEKPFDHASLISRVRQLLARYDPPSIPSPGNDISIRLNSLTPRERAILDLMIAGASSKRIARALGGSYRTIEGHRGRLMRKMDAASLADLFRMNMVIRLSRK